MLAWLKMNSTPVPSGLENEGNLKGASMKRVLTTVAFLIWLAGCANPPIAYHPASMMSYKDATTMLVDLSKKKNDNIEINEEFIKPDNINRIYFKSVESVAIYGKVSSDGLGGYSVYVYGKDGGSYVYKTYSMKFAEQYVDALESLVYAYKEKQKDLTRPETAASSSAQRMQDLQTLKDKGLITETEYQQKRKQILDNL